MIITMADNDFSSPAPQAPAAESGTTFFHICVYGTFDIIKMLAVSLGMGIGVI